MKCEHCEIDPDTIPEEDRLPANEVKPRPSMTAYYWDKEKVKEDPNRDVILCENCWMEYYDYWAERWDEYYGGRMC